MTHFSQELPSKVLGMNPIRYDLIAPEIGLPHETLYHKATKSPHSISVSTFRLIWQLV